MVAFPARCSERAREVRFLCSGGTHELRSSQKASHESQHRGTVVLYGLAAELMRACTVTHAPRQATQARKKVDLRFFLELISFRCVGQQVLPASSNILPIGIGLRRQRVLGHSCVNRPSYLVICLHVDDVLEYNRNIGQRRRCVVAKTMRSIFASQLLRAHTFTLLYKLEDQSSCALWIRSRLPHS